MVLILAALLGVRLLLAALLPLAPDEAYYFTWATHLQAGYLDHPPMVALWIRAGTWLCGPNPLGVRLLGPLAAFFGSLALRDAGDHLLPGRRLGDAAALGLNATLMIGAGAIIITPDTPLLFFWTLGLWALARLGAGASPKWWLAAGLFAGLMLQSKYTGALFLAAAGLWALFTPAIRAQLRTPCPWAGIALALLVFLPNIMWNAEHGWASYLKQGGRVAGFDPARAAQFFGELVAGQALLATPVIALLASAGLWRLRRDRTPGARLLLWFTLLPAAVFLQHVLTDRVQGNWVAILYPAAALALAAALPSRWYRPGLGLGFAVTLLAYAQALAHPFPLPAKQDTTALQLAGWRDFAQQAAATHPAFLTSDEYSTAAALAFYAPKDVPVLGFDKRWHYFDWPRQAAPGEVGIMVTRRTDTPCRDQLGSVDRLSGGQLVMHYRLCRFVAPYPGKELPRP